MNLKSARHSWNVSKTKENCRFCSSKIGTSAKKQQMRDEHYNSKKLPWIRNGFYMRNRRWNVRRLIKPRYKIRRCQLSPRTPVFIPITIDLKYNKAKQTELCGGSSPATTFLGENGVCYKLGGERFGAEAGRTCLRQSKASERIGSVVKERHCYQ